MRIDNKTIKTTIRLTEEEYAHLAQLAAQSYANISEYIRRRLFEEDFTDPMEHGEPKGRFNCDHDKELMRSQIIILALTRAMANKSLSKEERETALKAAKERLQDWGYE